MPILEDKVLKDVEKALQNMKKEVRLIFFKTSGECKYCKETQELLEEVQGTNKLLKLEIHQIEDDKEAVKQYGVDKTPAIVVAGEKDYGIRFYGIPAGYEFSSLLSAILMVSTGVHKLSEDGQKFLNNLARPIHLQVFVTPTCPYCPKAVILAQQMAYYSDKVKADMVEVSEFPDLGKKYSVQGVPRTVINEDWFQEGAAPENMLIEKIKEAL
ncbi:MAG: thioredoxin family protein [Candidatus Cloacimonadaceae bacterium]|nr:thioredoxin family protein [Candidatus Cloacimonadota bacterium]MDY0127659.1 thioredoxin family protein [Candidatus Cloacimonadaceae bacterium]MCB5254322.1 thioredoxin family protein [Candidatus Cloacimonadota bacterium]MCK9178854.1 thioredoxin family protein [Candidatus Cloacimonadota bacterium]MCK9243457.1 thioredoxin family protein [Candidatus Cloacimonadota bacterium]